MAQPELEPRVSRLPCKHFELLSHMVPESAQKLTRQSPCCSQPKHEPTLSHQMSQGWEKNVAWLAQTQGLSLTLEALWPLSNQGEWSAGYNWFVLIFVVVSLFGLTYLSRFIISHISWRANQYVGWKCEYPGKKHLTHPQVELDLSHIWPVWGSVKPTVVRWLND